VSDDWPPAEGATFYGVALRMAVGFITKFLVDLDLDALYFYSFPIHFCSYCYEIIVTGQVRDEDNTSSSRDFPLDFRFVPPLLIIVKKLSGGWDTRHVQARLFF